MFVFRVIARRLLLVVETAVDALLVRIPPSMEGSICHLGLLKDLSFVLTHAVDFLLSIVILPSLGEIRAVLGHIQVGGCDLRRSVSWREVKLQNKY